MLWGRTRAASLCCSLRSFASDSQRVSRWPKTKMSASTSSNERAAPYNYNNGPPSEEDAALLMKPIGYMITPFPEKNGCPRQGQLTSAPARLKLTLPDARYYLDGLHHWSHAHIIFHFHLNDPRMTVKPKGTSR